MSLSRARNSETDDQHKAIIVAVIGAVVLLLVLRLIKRVA